MTAPLLETTGLVRDFAGLRAVDHVDLSLQPGEVRALIGPNGAGKTTLVGLICGRLRPSAGRIRFRGRDITDLPDHKRIRLGMAYTFQITSIFPGQTVQENVALAARIRHGRAAAVRAAVGEVLARVGLADRPEAIAGTLSYGHQCLLELAMALVQEPALLILDEPTQGLAEDEVARFEALIRDMAGSRTILIIEHNMDVVMALATRVTVLNEGAVLAEGTPAEISANPAVQDAYLGGIDA